MQDSAYREELLNRLKVDQAIRDSFTTDMRTMGWPSATTAARMALVDSENTAWLRKRILTQGFPTPEQVGRDGVNAAFLLVQHADADLDFQEGVLPMIEAAYRRGTVDGQNLGLLTDRILKARGQKQRYGTQTTMRGGRIVIDPIDDSANVDDRRALLGLPPLRDYKRLLDSIYAPSVRR
ncbi:MAG TPA: DUF6624 domain-containing protein [Gemmatimonadaceae bacterium]